MWTVGFIVVPILFANLDDRRLAGELAGHLFSVINIIGLVCCLLILIGRISMGGTGWLKCWQSGILILMAVLILVMHFGLQPYMAEIKTHGALVEGSALAVKFAQLHKTSSLIYTLVCLLGLILVIFGLDRRSSK